MIQNYRYPAQFFHQISAKSSQIQLIRIQSRVHRWNIVERVLWIRLCVVLYASSEKSWTWKSLWSSQPSAKKEWRTWLDLYLTTQIFSNYLKFAIVICICQSPGSSSTAPPTEARTLVIWPLRYCIIFVIFVCNLSSVFWNLLFAFLIRDAPFLNVLFPWTLPK